MWPGSAVPALAPVAAPVTIMMIVALFMLASTLLLPLAFPPFVPFMPIMLAPFTLAPSLFAPLLLAPFTPVLVAVGRRRGLVDHAWLNVRPRLLVAISEAQLDAVLMGEHWR